MTEPLPTVFADLETDARADVAEAFLRLAVEHYARTWSDDDRVSTSLSPEEIAARFDEPLPSGGGSLDRVLERLRRDVLPESNHLTNPRAMGHQVSAPLPAAVWTEPVVAALNQSVAVWEMSPVGTILEARVLRWMCDLAGFAPGAGGTFTSGGTEATFTALLAARAAAMPNAWKEGVGANPPVVVHGEHAHYAVARAVGAMGLGTDHAVSVPSREWKMDAAALGATLERLAAEGRAVLAVVATAGSTATGSFDDLEAIGKLCEARGLWLHVDGAHGASGLFSAAHRGRLRGLRRARSIAWDPHKMMLMPLSAGMVLVRDERDLDAAFAQRAPYLFHARDGARAWDQGPRSFQCSRRMDVLKVWVALQRYGADGLGKIYDHLCAVAQALHAAIGRRTDFEALHEPEANILCFRWVGNGSITGERLDALNLRLREEFNRSGEGWITTTLLGGKRVLRVTVMNPRTGARDVERVLDGLGKLGARLAAVPPERREGPTPNP
ncbi:MAG: pyridoxal-dependent decarboxylase [Thermoanaerobaculia bacterium]